MTIWDREAAAAQGAAWGSNRDSTYRLQLIEKPAAMPIDFAAACDHLRLGDPASPEAAAQEALVERLIAAAVGEAQRYCDIAIMTQKWKLVGSSFASPLLMPKAPLQSVEKVTDATGAILDPASYSVVIDERLPGQLIGVSGGSVEFTAGWKTAEDVPAELIQALLLMVGAWFMNREASQAFTLFELPGSIGVQALLTPFRVEVSA